MNASQQARIERFLRLQLQLELDNILFELKSLVRDGHRLDSAEMIILASRFERLKNGVSEVLDLLDAGRCPMDFNPRDHWEAVKQLA